MLASGEEGEATLGILARVRADREEEGGEPFTGRIVKRCDGLVRGASGEDANVAVGGTRDAMDDSGSDE